MNNCIIGAGQLGSRHLQGLLKTTRNQRVYVVDPSSTSLEIAKVRANEVDHKHEIIFTDKLELLPEYIDIAIVATNSLVREKVITALLEKSNIKHLVLEKVLFPDLPAYANIGELITRKKIKTWVNHPRRMYPFYQELKNEISSENNAPLNMHVVGNNWGLGCNGLHFLDLMQYLSGETITSINTDFLNSEIKPSKRDGYIEFTGTLVATFSKGSKATLNSHDGEPIPSSILLSHPKKRYVIHEGMSSLISISANGEVITTPISASFQSNLTTDLLEELTSNGTCDLPSYKEASQIHKPFIKDLLSFHNRILHTTDNYLKIT